MRLHIAVNRLCDEITKPTVIQAIQNTDIVTQNN